MMRGEDVVSGRLLLPVLFLRLCFVCLSSEAALLSVVDSRQR